jgi:toxin ParE1/3/4
MDKWTYVLSQAAEEDLGQIFDYTELEFGFDQAVQYLSDVEQLFYRLCDNPLLGRERKEIRDGLRAIPCGSHVIFYRVLPRQIRVVRVLHASRDLPQFLKSTQ